MVGKIRNKLKNKNLSEIFVGSVWALLARVVATILGLLCSIFLARTYGADTVGIIAIINSFLMLATIPSLLGFNTSILRLIPEYRVKFSLSVSWSVYRKALLLVVLASLAVSIILYLSKVLIAEKLFSKPHLEFFLGLASIFIVFKTLSLLNTQAIRALKNNPIYALMLILPQSINLLFFILFWYLWAVDEAPIYAVLAGLIVTGLTGWLLVESNFKHGVEGERFPSPSSSRALLDTSLPMMMTGVISIISGEFGIIMLGIYGTEEDVGVFSIAVKLATLTGFVLKAINTIVAPIISELKYGDDESELFNIVKSSAKLIFWTTTPILIVLLIFGEWMLGGFFGEEFKSGYQALCILVLGQFVNAISGSTGVFLNMTGDQHVYRNIIFVGGVIFIGLNSILIPLYGMLGASISVFVTECIWNFSCLTYIKRKYGKTTGDFPLIG